MHEPVHLVGRLRRVAGYHERNPFGLTWRLNVRALINRIGSWAHYNIIRIRTPQDSIGNHLGPYIKQVRRTSEDLGIKAHAGSARQHDQSPQGSSPSPQLSKPNNLSHSQRLGREPDPRGLLDCLDICLHSVVLS